MLTKTFFVALALAVAAAGAGAATERWKLDDLYPSVDAWRAEAAALRTRMRAIAACRGRLGASARRLADCLELDAELSRRHERLAMYAHLRHDEDTALAEAKELEQQAERLGADLDEASAFLRPELLALKAPRLQRWVAAEPRLKPWRYPLQRLLADAKHTLDADGEALLATLGPALDGGEDAYAMLSDTDLPWPSVTLRDGSSVTVDQPGYERLRQLADRDDRKRAMLAFFGRWKDYERTFGVTFHQMLQRDRALAKARRHPDALAHALARDRLPRRVFDTLVEQADAMLPTLHRYLRLRARLLGVADLGYHDLYVSLRSGAEPRFTLERIRALLRDALAPLGAPYVATLDAGFDAGWMDVAPRPHKRSGAYVSSTWGVHPYMLLNHADDYESLTTLAHEWGHAMHSHLANAKQPFVTADYATFVAEIASTLNEALLFDHLLKTAADDDERLYYLGSALETLRATFFRQAMFAEFERDVHARAERGEPLAGQTLSALYGALLRRYHGVAQGVMTIDPAYDVEWAYVPHFYNRFYVFQYATSIAAAALLADDIVAGKAGARERALALFAAGGSDDPYRLVRQAGVDLATAAPYRALDARMNRIMDEIEAIVATRARRK